MIVTEATPIPYASLERIGKPENIETSGDAGAAAAPAEKKVSIPGGGGAGGAASRGAGMAGRKPQSGPAGRGGGQPPGPLFPIMSLSPYSNKCVPGR